MDSEIMNEHEMEKLEGELRQSLRHVAAPQGFEDRVMARVQQRESSRAARTAGRRIFTGAQRSSAWWQVAAAALLLTVGGDVMYLHHVREQRQAAAAQAEVDRALQLTSHALGQVQDGLDRSPAGRFTQVLFEQGK